jgi:endonuclease/exonuclease/phosphatase (EEP) superfamily protein YafD
VWHGRPFAFYGIHAWKPYPRGTWDRAWRDRQEILDWIRAERLPVVVAGDLNATPRSAFVRRLVDLGLTLASQEVLGHAPGTWPARPPAWLPPFRVAIDHVLHGPALSAVAFERGIATSSDHLPVFADLTWRDP